MIQNEDLNYERLIDSFNERLTHQAFQKILRAVNLKSSNGWISTKRKLIEELENNRSEFVEKFNDAFPFYIEHLLVLNKGIKIFQLQDKMIQKVFLHAKEIKLDKGLFVDNYPYVMHENDIEEIPFEKPFLVKRLIGEKEIHLIFMVKKYSTKRIELDRNKGGNEVREYFKKFESIVGFRRYIRIAFDIVTISKNRNSIELRVDQVSETTNKERAEGFKILEKKFNEVLSPKDGKRSYLGMPFNFFPLVPNLYSSGQGRVVELGFSTYEGSTKNEKMRVQNVDLRTELYHSAGKRAVGELDLFKISVGWDGIDSISNRMELRIPGNSRISKQVIQKIDEAIILGCYTLSEYDFVMDKIYTAT